MTLPFFDCGCIIILIFFFIFPFRTQLQQHPDIIKGSLPFVIKHLKAQSHVTHTYASAAVEKILMLKVSGVNNVAVITANDLKPLAEDLLQGLFGAFSMPGNHFCLDFD